jgi:transcriptional regulator with XRE-family HTH domain
MKRKKPGPAKGTKFSDVKRTPVGERLFKTRRARGFSQEELGKKINISKRMIAHYESADGDPTIETLKKMADALSVTVSYLTGESTQKAMPTIINPKLRRHLEKFQKLPLKDQKTVMRMVDGLAAENGTTDNAYGIENGDNE